MGRTIIREETFPKIIELYNTGGKAAAYDYLRSQYGIRHPYFVMNRIRECGKYSYNIDTDHFSGADDSAADGVFMWYNGTRRDPAEQSGQRRSTCGNGKTGSRADQRPPDGT